MGVQAEATVPKARGERVRPLLWVTNIVSCSLDLILGASGILKILSKRWQSQIGISESLSSSSRKGGFEKGVKARVKEAGGGSAARLSK